jgi:hypothetical protein
MVTARVQRPKTKTKGNKMNTQNNTNENTNAAATVVQNDTTDAAAASATANAAGDAYVANYKRIDLLITEREVWENGIVRTCNEQLYALLGKCYTLYIEMCAGTTAAKALHSALDDVIAMKGYSNSFNKNTHTLTKIVKCVFGVDRRRVSAYSLVLREALAQKLSADAIPAFVANGGGVEEIRRSKSETAMTPKQRAERGMQAVASTQLAVIGNDKVAEKIDAAKVGNYLVAIVMQQADGSLVVRQLIHSQSVLDAALACAYSENKKAVEKDIKNTAASNDDSMRDELIKNAAKS